MKNYTYWVLLRVSHSVTLRFTLVAPLYSPKANYSLVTGLYNTYLVEFGYHLEWFRSGALLKAQTKGPFQTITHTKFRCHPLIVTIKGTGNHYRKWFWSDALMGARIVGLVDTFTPQTLPPSRLHRLYQRHMYLHPILQAAFPAEYLCPDTGAAEQGGQNAKRVHLHPGPASDGGLVSVQC